MSTALLLLIGTIGAAWLLVAIARRPQRGVLALAALVPYHGLLTLVHVPSLLSGWKEGLVLYTAAASLASHSRRRKSAAGFEGMTWLLAAVVWVLLGVVSVLRQRNVQALIGFKVAYFYLLLPLSQVFAPLDRRDRDRLATVLMASGLVTATYGIAQQALGPAALHSWGYPYNTVIRTSGGHLRSFSTFNQPFPFAFFLMTVLLIGLPIALSDTKRTRNRIFLLGSPILVVGLLSAIVRGAILGLFAGLVVLGFQRYRGLLLIVPVSAAALVLAPASVTSAFFSSSSLVERSQTWGNRVNYVVQAPFGNGIGTTGSAAAKNSGLAGTSENSLGSLLQGYAGADTSDDALGLKSSSLIQPDNSYFVTVFELGVVGLWVMVLLLGTAATENMRYASRAGPQDRPWGDGIAALTVGVAVASLVATYLQIFPDELLFWLLLGVTAKEQVHSGPRGQANAGLAAEPTDSGASVV